MSKVFVTHKFDMNDADYIYGCKLLDKKDWEKFKKWGENLDYDISVYHNNDDTARPFSEIDFDVKEVSDEQATFLTELGLDDFGCVMPGWYAFEDDNFEDED